MRQPVVVLAEDDADLREVTQAMLEQEGYQVAPREATTFGSGLLAGGVSRSAPVH